MDSDSPAATWLDVGPVVHNARRRAYVVDGFWFSEATDLKTMRRHMARLQAVIDFREEEAAG